jgi:hypothetical protein
MVAPLKSLIQNAVGTFFDTDREQQVQTLANVIQRGIQTQGASFSLYQTLGDLRYSVQDLVDAKQRVYNAALQRGWSDGVLSPSEQKTATWLASRLELSPEVVRSLDLAHAKHWFGLALAHAMQDRIIDLQDEQRLQTIAGAVGCSMAQFMRSCFNTEGEAFLRSVFLACVADNRISPEEWQYLLSITQKFGLQEHEMLAIVQPQAQQFAEHVLADIKSDGRISPNEEQVLGWLLHNLRLPADFCTYALSEVQLIRTLADIDEGRLPSVGVPAGMEHRSGEIAHWIGSVTWREFRTKRGVLHPVDLQGVLALTDNRLIFSGAAKSNTVGYRKIVAHRGASSWFEVQITGKPVNQVLLGEPSPLPYAILRSAIAMANQTKLARLGGENSRHIPRDVRQRVWQRYGGRCAECGATTYLEFDHIIPVAKGGSNLDANVQLLCRMCNLKKSDFI